MQHKLVRIVVGVLEGLIALSAIGGGILLLVGTYQNGVLIEAGGQGRFPLEWLANTPFSDYTIPALVLAIGVGGSAVIGIITLFTGRRVGILASGAAGLILVGFISVEVILLKQGVSWTECLYGWFGLMIAGLAVYLWLVEGRRHHFPTRLRREDARLEPSSAYWSEHAHS